MVHWKTGHRMNIASTVCPKAVGATQPGHEDKPGSSPRGADIQQGLTELLGLFQVEVTGCTKAGRPKRTQSLRELPNQMHV